MPGSLFERLTLGQAGAELEEDESIRRHLARMLTTRQGAVQALPDYGLPDLNDLTLSRSEIVSHACSAIEFCIDTYEPRLTEPEVSSAPISDRAPFTLNFVIKAKKISASGALSPWEWNVSLEGNTVRGIE